jgi:hypothetical protein
MPFSTGLLAEFITYRMALAVYWFNSRYFHGLPDTNDRGEAVSLSTEEEYTGQYC